MIKNPELHVMDLMSGVNTINPSETHVTETIPRIDGKNKPGRLNKNNKTCKTVDKIVGNQLMTDDNMITVKSKKRNREEISISEGAHDTRLEGRQIAATEGAKCAPSLEQDASRDLSRMIRRKKWKTSDRKMPYNLDVSKSTVRTHTRQRIGKRIRKQAKVQAALVAL